jgi:hypothetical protein
MELNQLKQKRVAADHPANKSDLLDFLRTVPKYTQIIANISLQALLVGYFSLVLTFSYKRQAVHADRAAIKISQIDSISKIVCCKMELMRM